MFGIGRKICREGHIMDPSWRICPVCLAPVCAWLVVLNGSSKNKVFTLHEGKTKIGTGIDCECRILLNGISRHHSMILGKDGKYVISDLNSTNGTFVNNYQISNREIIDGDLIKLGDVEFKFKCL
jgi:pSer/pThr/pTyr-binding forkhead associated (FHA) protein